MEIKINIKKKHLYYLTILICFGLIGFVIADGWDPADPYHLKLFVDEITSKVDGNAVKITDAQGLEVTGTGGLSVTEKITTKDLDVEGIFNPKVTTKFIYKDGAGCGELTGEWTFVR